MGTEINQTSFKEHDFKVFEKCLADETHELEKTFNENIFQCDEAVGGFELEAWLIDDLGNPVPDNQKFLSAIDSSEIVPELSLFNFEINVEPQKLSGKALSILETRLLTNWQVCLQAAEKVGDSAVMIGIHPTIRDAQLNPGNMSKSKRYKALNQQILKMRSLKPLVIDIHGKEHLQLTHSDVMLEAATTSFQIHLKVKQEYAALAHTASQIVSAPLVAISANSPYVFNVDLWDESRIPIFEQAVDAGDATKKRVTYGDCFVKDSLFELFKSNLLDYPVVIPENHFDDDLGFEHVRLHNGTIWRWNRPLLGFNKNDSLHLRIENRVAPAGPSIKDMIANAAFYWGLVEFYIHDDEFKNGTLPFNTAKNNFYAAAQRSLDSELVWLDGKPISCIELILDQLLPKAQLGLFKLGILKSDAEYYLGIIKNRVEKKQNGAFWQRAWVSKNGRDMHSLTQAYIERQKTHQPIHEWEI